MADKMRRRQLMMPDSMWRDVQATARAASEAAEADISAAEVVRAAVHELLRAGVAGVCRAVESRTE